MSFCSDSKHSGPVKSKNLSSRRGPYHTTSPTRGHKTIKTGRGTGIPWDKRATSQRLEQRKQTSDRNITRTIADNLFGPAEGGTRCESRRVPLGVREGRGRVKE